MDKPYSSKRPIAIALSILTLLLVVGIWSISTLINLEHRRDLANWQTTLGILADTRVDQIQQWVDSQFLVLQELAENGSLQLYTKNLQQNNSNGSDTEPAQLSYLRNLIYSTAEKTGFLDAGRDTSPIKANVAFEAGYSLSLIDKNQTIITATPGASKPDEFLLATLNTVLQTGTPAFQDIHLSAAKTPLVGFLVPVFALQVQKGNKEVIAVLVGIKNASTTIFPLLRTTAAALQSDEAYLVRRDNNLITYLSPLADGTGALKRQLTADDPQLAAAFAVNSPGSFATLHDYRGKPVLMTSRSLPGLSWILVQKIDRDEALSESKNHQRFLFTALFLSLLVITAMLIATWWYGSSVREKRLAADLLSQSQELKAQTQLLTAINDNSSDYIFLLDDRSAFIFANKALADRLQTPAGEISGKGLRSVLGRNTAEKLYLLIEKCRQKKRTVYQEIDIELYSRNTVFMATVTSLADDNKYPRAVLLSLHDITELQESQKRQAHLLEQLIRALMRSIDLHDPYSANHSAKTARVAEAIGRAMNLDSMELKTLTTAAHLCNLGKLFIPKDILIKATNLTSEEKEILRKEAEYAATILEGINFDGPVLETIMQKLECLDGRGFPDGLRDKAIIPTARILSVANAFVAMISPRAYRDKFTVTEAAQTIISAADKCYDRQAAAALFHVVENVINWDDDWEKEEESV